MAKQKAKCSKHSLVIIPKVIKPKIISISSCSIPLCTACKLARAKKQNPEVKKQPEVAEKNRILADEKYLPGDSVSMDQYAV